MNLSLCGKVLPKKAMPPPYTQIPALIGIILLTRKSWKAHHSLPKASFKLIRLSPYTNERITEKLWSHLAMQKSDS